MTDTLVLGLGNPLRGDDGVGPVVIGWLRERGLPSGVTVVDEGIASPELVLTLESYRRAIIVDAADMGCAPGEWVRFTPDRVQLKGNNSALSLHTAGLADVLALGAALGQLPDEVIIFGVQPAQLEWSPGLSAGVQAAVPVVGRAVLQEIGRSYERPLGSQHGENSDH